MSDRRSRRRAAPCAAAMLLVAVLGAAAAGAPTAPGAPAEDIRDIRGPKFDKPEWIVAAVIVVACVAALGGYAVWHRRRAHPAPDPTPLELAERRLAAIRALMLPADSHRFAVEISAIVREFIERRFQVGATQLTTDEFLRTLLASSDDVLTRQRELLAAFLRQCDIVKFADVQLSVDAMAALHGSALLFVRATAQAREAHDSLAAT